MCSYFSSVVEKISHSKVNEDCGSLILKDPAYREKYKQWFRKAQQARMDIVQCYDGTIILIENKFVMRSYSWRNKKMDFERIKKDKDYKKDTK